MAACSRRWRGILRGGGHVRDLLLGGALAGFEFAGLRGQARRVFHAFPLLRGEALDLIDDGVNLLVQERWEFLEGVEFALVRGDGDFLAAQFRLRLLQAGLKPGLFAQQRALAAAQFVDLLLRLAEVRLQFEQSDCGGREWTRAFCRSRCRSRNRR